jgi:hypothetical protein
MDEIRATNCPSFPDVSSSIFSQATYRTLVIMNVEAEDETAKR